MKINEKNVISFAVCNSPIDKEGFLLKKGEVNKGFQKRWFVLKGNLLFYFEKPGDKEPIGVIILEGCTVELSEREYDAYSFSIVYPGPGCRSYILAAETQEEMEAWMKAITCAGYEYMKLMVSELQRQLDEHNKMTTLSGIKNNDIGKNVTELGTLMLDTPVPSVSNEPKPTSSQRFNPFNNLDITVDEEENYNPLPANQLPSPSSPPITPELMMGVSNFGNSSFFSEVSIPPLPTVTTSRSFEEMHELFGQQIHSLRQSMMLDSSEA
ncbi:sesquipedalian-1-like [Tubulanus polymorphus]|uniref:sesquipedalian-1-like n=1 Tax=Tubulanus polymorphus TaxID=672921 RepID=UPI003DA4A1C5